MEIILVAFIRRLDFKSRSEFKLRILGNELKGTVLDIIMEYNMIITRVYACSYTDIRNITKHDIIVFVRYMR